MKELPSEEEEIPFRIKTYKKKELACMYNPNITPRCAIRIFTKWIKINTWREDKFERSVANGTETVFVTLRFCVVRKQLKATLKPNAAGVQLPPHYYRNG